MKNLIFWVVCSFCVAISNVAFAHYDNQGNKYASYKDIPEVLIRHRMLENKSLEYYLASCLKTIRIHTKSGRYLDKEQINLNFLDHLANISKQQKLTAKKLDKNNDNIVTSDEVLSVLNKARKYAKGRYQRILDLDKNEDGVISDLELSNTHPVAKKELELEYKNSVQHEFLALDPNNDGRLTAKELRTLAYKAFRTVDLDQDEIISTEELENMQRARQKAVTNEIAPLREQRRSVLKNK